ncbi:MAG: hypothetical protein HY308_03780 [Gammaproteobacteria bacterium]|nr:hypothetical protein [Gammaproteobacteria bacterium]
MPKIIGKLIAASVFVLTTFVLTACGGGGGGDNEDPPGSCVAGVETGFGGNIEDKPRHKDGGGKGGEGGGSAGAGGGLGKVLGGVISVNRLADGSLIGEKTTDTTDGLVTITVCDTSEPLLVTLKGATGARYYDEGKNTFVDFGPEQELHALVDRFDESIGVSAFTEAAYRYALNKFSGNSAAIAAGKSQLLKTGNVFGLKLDDVREANELVLNEINRVLTTDTRLSSIKSLPTPVDKLSSNSSFPVSSHGIAAAVTGGFVKMAANYLPTAAAPALSATEQLARDLTDGKLDGFALDGSPATLSADLFYDAVRFPVALDTGTRAVSQQFGQGSTFNLGAPIVDAMLVFTTAAKGKVHCADKFDSVALLKDGSVSVRRDVYETSICAGEKFKSSTVDPQFATDVKQIGGSYEAGFLVKNDGSLWSWGEGTCGYLGNGKAHGTVDTPTRIDGLADVTSIAAGSNFAVARDKEGHVYTWGVDRLGQLGMGNAKTDLTLCDLTSRGDIIGVDTGNAYRANLTPKRIETLNNIVSVYASGNTPIVLAVDQAGTVFQWGLSPDAQFSWLEPFPVPGISSVVSVAIAGNVFAVKSDGTVWGWGGNRLGNFGDGSTTSKPEPQQVPGLSDVVQIATDGGIFPVVLRRDGTIRYWGDDAHKTPTALKQVGAPKIRHIVGTTDNVLLYGEDGVIYGINTDSGTLVPLKLQEPATTAHVYTGTGTTTTTTFGGPPYCTYRVTLRDMKMTAVVDQNNNLSASLSTTMIESTVGDCPHLPIPRNTHSFSGVGTVASDGTDSGLHLNPSSSNLPQDTVFFNGRVTADGFLDGTVTVRRTDIPVTYGNFDWTVQSRILPLVDNGNSLSPFSAVVSNADSRMEFFIIDDNNQIQHNWQVLPNSYWSGFYFMDFRHDFVPKTVAARNADGTLEVFGIGPDNAVWHARQVPFDTAWSRWSSLGGDVKKIAVGANADGRLEVFAIGSDGALLRQAQIAPSGDWTYKWVDMNSEHGSDVTAARNQDGRQQLFLIGLDGQVRTAWQTSANGSWSSWSALGGAPANQVTWAANQDGRIELFIVRDGGVWQRWQTSANGGFSNDWVSMNRSAVAVTATQNQGGRIELFVIAPDNVPWHAWQQSLNGDWSSFATLGSGGWLSSFAVGQNEDGRLQVFGVGADRAVWSIWQDPAAGDGWSGWLNHGGTWRSF